MVEVAVAEAGMMKALVELVMMVQTAAAAVAVGFGRVFDRCTWRRNSTTMRLSLSISCCC